MPDAPKLDKRAAVDKPGQGGWPALAPALALALALATMCRKGAEFLSSPPLKL